MSKQQVRIGTVLIDENEIKWAVIDMYMRPSTLNDSYVVRITLESDGRQDSWFSEDLAESLNDGEFTIVESE